MYQYDRLNETEFENLVIAICKELLGAKTQGFAKGKDGGRDAKFVGIANLYPSLSSPWQGTTIVQAKHTIGINKYFDDSDFFSETSESCKILQEIPKIKELFESGELNNYILFSNRRMPANVHKRIIDYIVQATGLAEFNIALIGVEELDYWLSRYEYIPKSAQINLVPIMKSPIIHPEELSEIISHFAEVFNDVLRNKESIPVPRLPYEEKNQINNLSKDYAKLLRNQYISFTHQINDFLSDPQNLKLQKLYQEAIDEFQIKFIYLQQKEHELFDTIFDNLVDYLVERDNLLSRNRKLTRMMVFYMYWNCDIGKTE